jgi:hypothetical protein
MYKLIDVQVVRPTLDTLEVWDADEHLYDLALWPLLESRCVHDLTGDMLNAVVGASLRGYNAGRTSGELTGRLRLQGELCQLLNAAQRQAGE